MKTISKILLICMVLVISIMIVPQVSSRVEAVDLFGDDTLKIEANTAGSTEAAGSLTNVVNKILGFLQIASALLAVIMIAVTGFRYIMETPEMKNELKKSMVPIIVGILLVFFAASIAKFFIGMFASK